MIVRRAELKDARAIAAIHVHAWQAAYQGIVPSAVLDSLSIEDRENRWRTILDQRASETWVAEEDDKVVGWISAARSRDEGTPSTTGEVWGIYVDPAQWRRGVGWRLWREAAAFLEAAGFLDITLWVLKENAPAIAFYESIGLVVEPGDEKAVVFGGATLLEIRLRKRLVSNREHR